MARAYTRRRAAAARTRPESILHRREQREESQQQLVENKLNISPRKGGGGKSRRSSRFVPLNLFVLLFLFLFAALNLQQAKCSRKFMTGLIIGTLLARQGYQQGPVYHQVPASGSQQQPLLIIIPSAGGGKSSYKNAPQVVSPYSATRSDLNKRVHLTPLRRRLQVAQSPSTRIRHVVASHPNLITSARLARKPNVNGADHVIVRHNRQNNRLDTSATRKPKANRHLATGHGEPYERVRESFARSPIGAVSLPQNNKREVWKGYR